MNRRKDESYIKYKRRVIDPISSSFCAAKWLDATVWLGSGSTTSCHLPPAHHVDLEALKENPSALHNTEHKKRQRAKMLRGERPKECEYCWRIEDMERDAVSDRVFKTIVYSEDAIEKARVGGAEANINPETLEIAFDRTCNFACSYCNAAFSTTWAKDIRNEGPYQHLISDGAQSYQGNGNWADAVKTGEVNPYVDAFWRWWPELSKSLKKLRITGGEPLLSPEIWKLFDFFEQNGSGELVFGVNSNLGGRDELITKLIEKSKFINQFDFYTSNESVSEQAEYIRDGLSYNRWCYNVERVIKEGNLRTFNVMMTINSLSLFTITDFMDQMLRWKEAYGKDKPIWSVNILRFPSFMSPLVLPDDIRQERYKHLHNWLAEKRAHPLIREYEYSSVKRLIDYLEVVDQPHWKASEKEVQRRDFKSFYEQYDARRGKKIRTVFPQLSNWLDQIEVIGQPHQELVSEDAREAWE